MRKFTMFATCAALAFGMSGTAMAELDGAALYTAKGCAGCHGADANTPIMPTYPKIAWQNAAYTVQQLKDIKSGARNNGQTAAMKGIVAMVSDEEIEAIAEYLENVE
jgi:cytochrome c